MSGCSWGGGRAGSPLGGAPRADAERGDEASAPGMGGWVRDWDGERVVAIVNPSAEGATLASAEGAMDDCKVSRRAWTSTAPWAGADCDWSKATSCDWAWVGSEMGACSATFAPRSEDFCGTSAEMGSGAAFVGG